MIDAVVGVVVADLLEHVARKADVVDVGVRGDFAGEHHETGGAERFGGDAAHRVFGEAGVEDGVRDLIRDFVGMTFTDGFGSKEIFMGHSRKTPVLRRRSALRSGLGSMRETL